MLRLSMHFGVEGNATYRAAHAGVQYVSYPTTTTAPQPSPNPKRKRKQLPTLQGHEPQTSPNAPTPSPASPPPHYRFRTLSTSLPAGSSHPAPLIRLLSRRRHMEYWRRHISTTVVRVMAGPARTSQRLRFKELNATSINSVVGHHPYHQADNQRLDIL